MRCEMFLFIIFQFQWERIKIIRRFQFSHFYSMTFGRFDLFISSQRTFLVFSSALFLKKKIWFGCLTGIGRWQCVRRGGQWRWICWLLLLPNWLRRVRIIRLRETENDKNLSIRKEWRLKRLNASHCLFKVWNTRITHARRDAAGMKEKQNNLFLHNLFQESILSLRWFFFCFSFRLYIFVVLFRSFFF